MEEQNIEFGNIKSNQKLGTLTIKTPKGNVKFEFDSGENKVIDLTSYASQQGPFMGNWNTYASVPSTVSGFTDIGYDPPVKNSFLIVQSDETHGNQVSKYRYDGEEGENYSKDNWDYEFGIETNISLTDEQTAAVNSGITQEILSDIQDRLGEVEQFSQESIIQPIMGAIQEEAQERTTQVSTINGRLSELEYNAARLGTMSRYNVQFMTQDEYDSLSHRDATTIYFITDNPDEEVGDSDEEL